MARKKTTADPAGATLAPRPRGHRSLVTKRDLQAYRRRLEAELAELHGQRADLEEATSASTRSSPTPAASPSSASATCRWSTTPRT
jgi:hypothetical protein